MDWGQERSLRVASSCVHAFLVDSEEVDGTRVNQFIIRPPPQSAAEKAAEEQKKKQEAEEGDPNQLLGATVVKTSTSYEGKALVSSGRVTQYFADIKMFRVLFSDGMYSDMTLEAVKRSLKDAGSDVTGVNATPSKLKHPTEATGEVTSPSKKSKQHHHSGHSHGEKGETERPLNTTKFPSRKAAYVVCREVLNIIVSQKKVGKSCTDKQKTILKNKDIQVTITCYYTRSNTEIGQQYYPELSILFALTVQPKRALENFVEADGLRSLEAILKYWFKLESTRPGALLVLKVLAVLPGVTEEVLRKTTIGPTLRSIEKISRTMGHVDSVLGDLAQWTIKKWTKTAMKRSFHRSARDLLLEQQAQISRVGNGGQVYVAPPQPSSKAAALKAETARLEALRTGAKVDGEEESEVEPGEEVVVYLPQFNSLGSEDMRRPVRQTQVIESLASKINRDYEDAVKRHDDNDDGEQDDGVTHGRMVFRKPQMIQYNQNTPVIDLFATARTKLMGAKNSAVAGGDGSVTWNGEGEGESNSPPKPLPLPNKTKTPSKSILKVMNEVVTPASQMIWE
ncbi:hypothetical protein BBJ28_00004713 [Nothophytophthora sp. Chile5]|nr:hypothetical protein BBJ28_00004713 [Nothophytophthora sp. Chile5]